MPLVTGMALQSQMHGFTMFHCILGYSGVHGRQVVSETLRRAVLAVWLGCSTVTQDDRKMNLLCAESGTAVQSLRIEGEARIGCTNESFK